ncbi:unnamed protein product, partial [Scytosiphon promiscuus]
GKVANERNNPFLAALYHCWPDASRISKFAVKKSVSTYRCSLNDEIHDAPGDFLTVLLE